MERAWQKKYKYAWCDTHITDREFQFQSQDDTRMLIVTDNINTG